LGQLRNETGWMQNEEERNSCLCFVNTITVLCQLQILGNVKICFYGLDVDKQCFRVCNMTQGAKYTMKKTSIAAGWESTEERPQTLEAI
jgi:hypothetical protein